MEDLLQNCNYSRVLALSSSSSSTFCRKWRKLPPRPTCPSLLSQSPLPSPPASPSAGFHSPTAAAAEICQTASCWTERATSFPEAEPELRRWTLRGRIRQLRLEISLEVLFCVCWHWSRKGTIFFNHVVSSWLVGVDDGGECRGPYWRQRKVRRRRNEICEDETSSFYYFVTCPQFWLHIKPWLVLCLISYL